MEEFEDKDISLFFKVDDIEKIYKKFYTFDKGKYINVFANSLLLIEHNNDPRQFFRSLFLMCKYIRDDNKYYINITIITEDEKYSIMIYDSNKISYKKLEKIKGDINSIKIKLNINLNAPTYDHNPEYQTFFTNYCAKEDYKFDYGIKKPKFLIEEKDKNFIYWDKIGNDHTVILKCDDYGINKKWEKNLIMIKTRNKGISSQTFFEGFKVPNIEKFSHINPFYFSLTKRVFNSTKQIYNIKYNEISDIIFIVSITRHLSNIFPYFNIRDKMFDDYNFNFCYLRILLGKIKFEDVRDYRYFLFNFYIQVIEDFNVNIADIICMNMRSFEKAINNKNILTLSKSVKKIKIYENIFKLGINMNNIIHDNKMKLLELLFDYSHEVNNGKAWIYGYLDLYFNGSTTIDKIMYHIKMIPMLKENYNIIYLLQNINYIDVFPNDMSHKPFVEEIGNLIEFTTTDLYYLESSNKIENYDSSQDIIKIFKDRYNLDLFIPRIRNCFNKDDILFNDYENEEETPFVFAIGNYKEYICYSFDLIESLIENNFDRLQSIPLNIIGNNEILYLDPHYESKLIYIIRTSKYPEDKKEKLLSLISKIGSFYENDEEILTNFEKIQDKDLLFSFFEKMFQLGMLTRRWNPERDGDNFPYKIEGTRHGENGINEEQMAVIITEFFILFKSEIINKLNKETKNFISKLICYTKYYEETNIERSNSSEYYNKIWKLIELTYETEDDTVMCQRVASNTMIMTGYYYLLLLFKYNIPGFNADELVGIQ